MAIGVNIFFLLSGWCRINFRWSKVISLAIKVYIVFGLIQVTGLIFGTVPFNMKNVLYMLDPLDHYWFVMTYILLMFTSKTLNVIVDNWSISDFKKYVVGFLIICCIYGFLLDKNLHINSGYSFLMAMALYLLGGGLHKFLPKINVQSNWKLAMAFIGSVLLNSIVIVILYKCGKEISWEFYSYNNVLVVIESVSLLLLFATLRELPDLKIIHKLAGATIMVYIIHSTCWLTSLRKIPIVFTIDKFGFWASFICLPIYAMCIFCLGYLLNIVYEKAEKKLV